MTNPLSCALVLAALALTSSPAASQWAPWCLSEGGKDEGAVTCIFHSFEQCLETLRGIGGSCGQNPYSSSGTPQPGDARRDKRKRRK
jgi:Protein of unknown function (DUF3551)